VTTSSNAARHGLAAAGRIGFAAGACVAGALAACAAPAPPRVVHQDRVISVRLIPDTRSATPHAHPAHLTNTQVTRILAGLRVLRTGGATQESLEAGLESPRPIERREGLPVFSRDEVRMLAPYLAKAFGEATPQQLVVFHLKGGQLDDPSTHPVVTSGGLFLDQDLLYVVLANYRTKPFGEPLEGSMVSELDLRSDPLVPIMRGGYALGFSPTTARVRPAAGAHAWEYVEEQKVIVLDLPRVAGKGLE
jgi:hypothetical protein